MEHTSRSECILPLFSKGLTMSPLLSHTNFVRASGVLTTSSLLFDDEFFALLTCETL